MTRWADIADVVIIISFLETVTLTVVQESVLTIDITSQTLVFVWSCTLVASRITRVAQHVCIIGILLVAAIALRITVNIISLMVDIASGGTVKPEVDEIRKNKCVPRYFKRE